MSDYETLHELFIKHGSAIKPGEDINIQDWQKATEFAVRHTEVIRSKVAEINSNMETRGLLASPFCNPVIIVYQRIEFIARYFCGEFEIQTKDKRFRETFAGIGYELIKGGYFGTIYVGYGEDFEEIDKRKFADDGKNLYLEGIPGKFRLFRRESTGTFTSVLSEQSGLKFTPEQQRRIIKCESGGYMRGLHWFQLWMDREEGMARFSASTEALSKNVVLTPKTEQEHQSIIKQFKNGLCFIKRDGSQVFGNDSTPQMGKTKFEEVIFMPRETPMVIFECINRKFEADASQLGYAPAIPQQKKERINSGENFPHQKLVSNITTELLRQLNYIFDRMRFAFPENAVPYDLKIVRANQAEAQGLPHIQQGGTFNNFNKPFGGGFNRLKKFGDYDRQGND